MFEQNYISLYGDRMRSSIIHSEAIQDGVNILGIGYGHCTVRQVVNQFKFHDLVWIFFLYLEEKVNLTIEQAEFIGGIDKAENIVNIDCKDRNIRQYGVDIYGLVREGG